MAASSTSHSSCSISTNSHDTALCIVPPHDLCGNIDRLRELYDKGYGKWPPHVNLIYPFVSPENLPKAQEQIQTYLNEHSDRSESNTVNLNNAGMFAQRSNSTIFLQENGNSSKSSMNRLRSMAFQALGQKPNATHLHLTIGQTEDNTLSSREYLMSKARLLPALDFHIGALVILLRERATETKVPGKMKLWGLIDLRNPEHAPKLSLSEFWLSPEGGNISDDAIEQVEKEVVSTEKSASIRETQPGTTYTFDTQTAKWIPIVSKLASSEMVATMMVASYNVLIDSEYPPARDRDPLLLRTILGESAAADILVLQEVSDDFLSYFLENSEVRRLYPVTSHGPPSQSDIGPLPSLRNIVILSRFTFTWKFVPFQRRHKGAVVAAFSGTISSASSEESGFAVAGVHLTCGLTDGSVAAKKIQLDNLLNFLRQHHRDEPWVIAGDFNIPTSTYTVDTALKSKSISSLTVETLHALESTITNAGLLDAWAVARVEATDESSDISVEDLFEGEDGATFNPRENVLAAATSGTCNGRPQRYDRVLVRPNDTFQVARFGHFGLPEQVDGVQVVPSDHSGIRAELKVLGANSGNTIDTTYQISVEYKRVHGGLSQSSSLASTLNAHEMFPTEEEIQQHQQAFALIERVVLGTAADDSQSPSDVPMVMVSVGSYALNVWTKDSDIDCLCIGTISSKTFFKLARQRLVKAEAEGVRILRKVEANTGTMLELSVNGISMDLQYCPAARVVEKWPEFRNLPASDPIFNLSILSLRKLKPYRDLVQIQRTLPSMPTFRLAYRCIKLWATQRGIYAAKLGYLGGVHITLMLSYICKRLVHDHGSVTVGDLVASFFHHFANFDWANNILYDTFFHKQKPRYHRTTREPMVVLGYHAPNSNIAHTSTVPGLQALVQEFKTADEQLSTANMSWDRFLGGVRVASPGGIQNFLAKYESYVKVDIQFWGRTLAKGKGLVGWVESRCLWLVVEIHKLLPDSGVRLWPARFTDSDSDEGNDYQGSYLIGLSGTHCQDVESQSLDKVFDRFLNQLKAEEKFYDPESSWIGISLANPRDLTSHGLDTREWGTYTTDMEPDSDDEDETFDEPEDLRDKRPVRTIPQRPKPTSKPVSATKLRPASDVLNRLRWDPNLDPAEYIIGYEDRFLGAKETSLERWKTEQTDEEFIPQHRILYFKRRSGDAGGEIVWERASRIDKVFGSGVGAG